MNIRSLVLMMASTLSAARGSPLSGLVDSIEHKKHGHHDHLASSDFPQSDGDAQLDAALRRGGGVYRRPPPGSPLPWRASLNRTVLAVSCNYAVRDLLLNWACHADRLGLNFLLLAMDAELAAAARGPWAHLVPSTYFSPAAPAGFTGKAIDPHVHNAWRHGQFNAVSVYKLAAVARVLERGYRVLFSDVDVVFFSDPVPALFPWRDATIKPAAGPESSPSSSALPLSRYSAAGVLLPLADFAYQQNVCGWAPGKGWPTTGPKGEGNTGFYVMHPTHAMRAFLAAAVARCARFPKLDDQTNLFDELRENWLGTPGRSKGRGAGAQRPRAVQCIGGESDAHPIGGAYAWPLAAAGRPMRTCPLPRLPFATGFAHRDLATWRAALAQHGNVPPVLLHFNCLGRGGGHDAKRRAMEASPGAWVWGDGRGGGDGSTGSLTPPAEDPGGTCLPFTAA